MATRFRKKDKPKAFEKLQAKAQKDIDRQKSLKERMAEARKYLESMGFPQVKNRIKQG